MRPVLFVSLLSVLTTVVLGIEFINPPPFETTDLPPDFSLNPVYVKGSILTIRWTAGPPENNTSLTLYQLNGTQPLGPFEYLTRMLTPCLHYLLTCPYLILTCVTDDISPSVLTLAWTVQTTKDLTLSSMFSLFLFLEGATSPEANTYYFNITNKEVASPTFKDSSSTTITTGSTSATVTESTTPAPISASTTPILIPVSGGLSTGAKVGLGIGIPAVALLGFCVGWFIFSRWKRQHGRVPLDPAIQNYFSEQGKWTQKNNPWSAESIPGARVHQSGSRESMLGPGAHQLSGDQRTLAPSIYELHESR